MLPRPFHHKCGCGGHVRNGSSSHAKGRKEDAKMLKAGVGAAVAVALVGLAPSGAIASVAIYTFEGAASGYGGDGSAFGMANTFFVNVPFKAVFTRNDATVGATTYDTACCSGIFGMEAASPVAGRLEINGFAFDFGSKFGQQSQFDGDIEGFQLSANNSYEESIAPDLVRSVIYAMTISANGSGTDYLSGDYRSLGSLTPDTTPGWTWNSQVSFGETVYNAGTNQPVSNHNYGWALLTPTTMSVVSSPVPEPETWALSILGFGIAGLALRRRRMNTRIRFCGALSEITM